MAEDAGIVPKPRPIGLQRGLPHLELLLHLIAPFIQQEDRLRRSVQIGDDQDVAHALLLLHLLLSAQLALLDQPGQVPLLVDAHLRVLEAVKPARAVAGLSAVNEAVMIEELVLADTHTIVEVAVTPGRHHVAEMAVLQGLEHPLPPEAPIKDQYLVLQPYLLKAGVDRSDIPDAPGERADHHGQAVLCRAQQSEVDLRKVDVPTVLALLGHQHLVAAREEAAEVVDQFLALDRQLT